MTVKKSLIFYFFLFFIIQILQIFYFQRSSFLSTYDVLYWKDRFEHSQWKLPLSKRIIGDDGLFSYVGYNLAKGADPSLINPETQPVGKYLIGFSILFFKNSSFYSLIFGFLSLTFFYILARKLLKDKVISVFISLVLFLDPLFFSQFWKAWIDITQLFFLLLNIVCLLYLKPKNEANFKLALLSGLSIGFFMQTKFPIIFPILFILETIFLFKNRLKKEYLVYLIGAVMGTLIPYINYFILGHSIFDFMRLQKFIISFYDKSLLTPHIGAIWETLIFGKFKEIFGENYINVSEWWIIWPISSGLFMFSSLLIFLKKNSNDIVKGLIIFVLFSLLILTIIPSYPRYLLVIIPFIYILSGYFINTYLDNRFKIFIFLILPFYGIFNAWFFLIPKPDWTIKNFYYNYSHQYFQDIFQENLAKQNRPNMNRDKFHFSVKNAFDDATVKAIEIKEINRNVSLFSKEGVIKFRVRYFTQDLGYFEQQKQAKIIKEDEQWKIIWDWNLILDGFTENSKIETLIDIGTRGTIIDNKGNILAEDKEGYMISLNPEIINLKKEQKMLELLGKISGIKPVHLQNAYLENVIAGTYVPLFTLYTSLTPELRNRLLAFPGIRIDQHNARIYDIAKLDSNSIENTIYKECCTRIYSAYNYHGVYGIEKKYDSILWGHSGGSIKIIDKKGNVVKNVLSLDKKDGGTIVLSL